MNDVFQLNEAGQVLGYSNRYNGGSTSLGQSTWLYNGATTIDIGLTGNGVEPVVSTPIPITPPSIQQ